MLPKKGKIFKFYVLGGGNGRQYFSDENTCKIDAIRKEIEILKFGSNEYFAMIASLLESSDSVANTGSVYGAFLKHLKNFNLTLAKFIPSFHQNEIYQMDASELIGKIYGDILYLDPPYNHREYRANYHLLNTITLTGLRNYAKLVWCKKKIVINAF